MWENLSSLNFNFCQELFFSIIYFHIFFGLITL